MIPIHRLSGTRLWAGAAALGALLLVLPPSHAEGEARSHFNLGAVQGLLAVQQLDGWLLYENRGQNPIADGLVNPAGEPSRRWFYLIPAQGEPIALVHKVDLDSFRDIPGRKLSYAGHGDLQKSLATMLKGFKQVAMEYSPKAALPDLSRVDAGTVELVRARGVKIVSSAELVQIANSVWGKTGRRSHYVAAHHLSKLRQATLAYITRELRRGKSVTELDVQKFIEQGYAMRGLTGPAPIVAAGAHTANPSYLPTEDSARPLEPGDLLVIEMRARLAKGKRPIFAETTWMAYLGSEVPPQYANAFAVVVRARDAALRLVRERTKRHRAIRGYEVDRRAREVIDKAGHGDKFLHRTGHSLDTNPHSSGVGLDDYETRDRRVLMTGAGFAIRPGIYLSEFGVRTGVTIHVGRRGVEVTAPAQKSISALSPK